MRVEEGRKERGISADGMGKGLPSHSEFTIKWMNIFVCG